MIISNNITEIKEYIISTLENELTDVKIVDGYITGEYPGKLKKPTLCVCLTKVKAKGDTITGLVEVNSDVNLLEETVGENVTLRFTFYVYAPKNFDENDCNDIFMTVCETLLFDERYSFADIETDEIKFDDRLQFFHSKITAELEVIYTKTKQYQAISSYEMDVNAK